MKKSKLFPLIIFLITCTSVSLAQVNFGFQFLSASAHFDEMNKKLYTANIDPEGQFGFEPGVMLSMEFFTYKNQLAFRLEQGIHKDMAAQTAGFTHIGARIHFMKKKSNHSFNIAFGPTIFYRKTWKNMEGYEIDETYSGEETWQSSFSVISGAVEYRYRIAPKIDLAFSLNHSGPKSVSFGAGIHIWMSTNFNGGCNCGGYRRHRI